MRFVLVTSDVIFGTPLDCAEATLDEWGRWRRLRCRRPPSTTPTTTNKPITTTNSFDILYSRRKKCHSSTLMVSKETSLRSHFQVQAGVKSPFWTNHFTKKIHFNTLISKQKLHQKITKSFFQSDFTITREKCMIRLISEAKKWIEWTRCSKKRKKNEKCSVTKDVLQIKRT